jgi:multiple sugar transport system ATP-binding protein
MIYVTHDQVEAMTMGDRIVVMKDGVIQQVDDPIALYDNPGNMFVAGFIGSPPMNFFRGTIQPRANGLWFAEQTDDAGRNAGFSVPIDEPMVRKLTVHVGKPVVLGVRPEDITDHPRASAGPANQSVAATIEVVEPMGAEVYVHLNTGGHSFVARVDSHEKIEVGQRLDIVFDMRKSHFFDAQTEQAVA